MSDQCFCSNATLVWSHIAQDGDPLHGPRQLRKQCPDCGRLLPQAIAQHNARRDTPTVDVEAVKRWNDAEKAQFLKRRQSFLATQGEAWGRVEQTVAAEYSAYLQTDQWRAKRLKVLELANYVCEGCGDNRATEVHHLSYRHLGKELLWELKAVCSTCHDICHPDKRPNREAAE